MSLIDTQKDKIYDLISSNKAFKNPFDAKITEINSVISSYVPEISGSTLPPLVTQEIINAIALLQTSITKFKTHTDNLSGIGLSNGLNGANFATISQIVATVNKYKNDNSTCELIYSAFGALIKVAQMVQYIDNLITHIKDFVNYPDRLLTTINQTILAIENQIQQDLIAFANAQLDALRLAVASAITSLIGNPCIGEIISIIGTNEVKDIIKENVPKIQLP